MTEGGTKSTPFSEKLIAILLCKGDLSEDDVTDEKCSTMELFLFASARQKVFFVVGILLVAITGLMMPINQILGGLIAEAYLEEPNAEGNDSVLASVMVIVSIYAGLSVVQLLFNFIQQFLLLRVTDEIVDKLRREYVSAVLKLDAETLDSTSSGQLSSSLNENIDKIRDGLGEKFALVIKGFCIFISSIAIAFWYNWRVALVLLPLGPLGAVITGLAGRFSAGSIGLQMEASAKGATLVEESIMNVKTVASCNGQDDMIKKYRSILGDLITLGTRVSLIYGFFEGLFFFLIYFFGAIALLVGVPDTFNDSGFNGGSVIIAFGSILVGAYFLGLLGPHMMTLLKARMAAAIIYKTIDKAATLDQLSDGRAIRLKGDILFRNVRFKYASRDGMVLQGLSWSVQAGQSIGLAGHSGCGKSTTVGLLTKLYEKCGGDIIVDGKGIEEYDRKTIRKNIGVVAQEPCLFNGTIRDNIILGREWKGNGTSEQRLMAVSRIAQALHFVQNLEKGFDTVLGDGGISLSGGQKQRIAIARAIFMDPPILILDEATSALDVHSEKLVQAALRDASVGRTTIYIAHRLSTLKDMDVIFVMDGGVVIEQGNHEKLLSMNGAYALMAQRQNISLGRSSYENMKDKSGQLLLRDGSRASSTHRTLFHPSNGKESQSPFIRSTTLSSFLRIYTHGHLTKILPALLFSIFRGLEMPGYCVLVCLTYSALSSTKDEFWPKLAVASGVSLAIALWVCTANTLAYFFSSKASESVIGTIKERILSRVLYKDAEYFDNADTSNATIVNNINEQPSSLLAGLDGRAILFVYCSTSIFICNIAALIISWQMGVISVILYISTLIIVYGLFRIFTNLTERHSTLCKSSELALEIFSQARTIQVMAVEGFFEQKYIQSQTVVAGTQLKSAIVQSIIFSIGNGCIYLFGLVSFAFGAHFVYHGVLTGQALYIVGLTIEFCAFALAFITPTFPEFARANAAARILYSYYDLPEHIDIGEDEKELTGALQVCSLSFAYSTRPNQKVTNELSISAKAGDSIALVGPSGCGKSTLISLLERFYTQQEGRIIFDSVDHRRFAIRHLRSQIALVGQEPVLFQGSIADNILLGCSQYSLDDVREACRMANAANFIESLPEGYETDVGSSGHSFSGGQKQRIAIARALVRKPKILLLDEATSALDGESEQIVQEAISKASEDRTTITIAHRLATIKDSTCIYFIDEGTATESGTHEYLIHLNGKYASYVKEQSLESK